MSAHAQQLEDEGIISLADAVELGSEDPEFYGRFFFPRAARQQSPLFHEEMWEKLLGHRRHVAFEVFRGGAKTTTTRLFMSYCTSYAISRTIMVVGKSQDHAIKSVEWLKNAVTQNQKWANAFGLKKGSKWSDAEIDIRHEAENVNIRVLAYGMTGSIRGVNIDDFRPDLIIVDDPCDEENTATPEQRKKINDLFYGALDKSLAPRSDAPLAKMVLLQTVLNGEDLISQCIKDPTWDSVVYGCFDQHGESRWPARWTTEELQKDKEAHIARNQLSLWLREMECKIVSDETAAFPSEWLQYWEVLPEGGRTWLACDPTPPPKDSQQGKINPDLDDAVVVVLKEFRGDVYVCETYDCKSPDPLELIGKMFEMALRWKVREVHIETVLFARMMATIMRAEMARRRHWLTLREVEDKRRKDTRIRQEISPRASNRKIFVHENQTKLIEQFTTYPAVNHDDFLDALAIGLMKLSPYAEADESLDDYLDAEYEVLDDYSDNPWVGGAP